MTNFLDDINEFDSTATQNEFGHLIVIALPSLIRVEKYTYSLR